MKEPDLPVYDDDFPTDDEYSLQEQGAKDINIFYGHQYVQNEEVINQKAGTVCSYHFQHGKVVPDTVTGIIYHDDYRVQTFFPANFNNGQKFAFTAFPHDGPKVVKVEMNDVKGVLTLTWDKKVRAGKTKVVVNYEYDQ